MPAVAAAALFTAAVSCSSLSSHFVPSLEIEEARYPDAYAGPKPITARDAFRSALQSLERRGGRDIRFCQIRWQAAGTGAAIVLATGRLEKDGVVFNAFAVGIHDGTDAKYGLTGGKEYLMIARGTAANGAETYYDNGRILPYTEIAGDPDLELMFEEVTREELMDLPAKCGTSAGRARARNLH
ncbi:MAG: hypothetical protein ACXW29_11890 [Thermoanaerobaculia bacterium]